MSENWLPLPGYEGLYSVSDLGNVRSEDRTITTSRGARLPLHGRTLKPFPNAWGYLRVELCRDRRHKIFTIHSLVALAFHGPRPDHLEIRHLDGNQVNNRPANLAYGTRSENARDVVRHGNNYMANKTHYPQGHTYDEVNTYFPPSGGRRCRICLAEQGKARRMNKKEDGK